MPVASGGLWNLRTLHVVEADTGSGADWDTHWATFVVVVDAGRRSRAAGNVAANDSAAVVAVVERYHEALARGDSATALALLASDAVILESGGIESREEYRSHHLPGDIAFARAVTRERGPMRVRALLREAVDGLLHLSAASASHVEAG